MSISPSNPHIKRIVKIRKEKKARLKEKKVLIVGTKALSDIKKAGHRINTLITTKKIGGKKYKPKKTLLVSKKVMGKITNVKSPEDVAALVDLPEKELTSKDYVLILDNISDPGNLGTIIRSANAFKFDMIIISENSTDPYGEKALRAAKGATFFIPIRTMSENKIFLFIQKNKLTTYLADVEGVSLNTMTFKKPLGLIMSNEAKGPSEWTKKISKRFTIPIKKDIDSLNVAIAASICMYEMRK
ncbi:MAG: 23S rRNA (guanosine-2'-O-)-methyltransferase RlmB [Candidatus Anoxychlamydiales bacterium]|nr:23S rRNA (guanosine-2'-O-)-methyltransferase RlmB [Candidatus Anoxychlamydiales bacterium]NGX36144.1 23S rRNA (guanosine-2'-O-)-methyltransferase RlmB [Candidatus Anoxychlamydiales bacterium]